MGVESTILTVLFTLKGREVYSVCTWGGGNLSILPAMLCIRNDTPQKIENPNMEWNMLFFNTHEWEINLLSYIISSISREDSFSLEWLK